MAQDRSQRINDKLVEIDGRVRVETDIHGKIRLYKLEAVAADVETTETDRWELKGVFDTAEESTATLVALLAS